MAIHCRTAKNSLRGTLSKTQGVLNWRWCLFRLEIWSRDWNTCNKQSIRIRKSWMKYSVSEPQMCLAQQAARQAKVVNLHDDTLHARWSTLRASKGQPSWEFQRALMSPGLCFKNTHEAAAVKGSPHGSVFIAPMRPWLCLKNTHEAVSSKGSPHGSVFKAPMSPGVSKNTHEAVSSNGQPSWAFF